MRPAINKNKIISMRLSKKRVFHFPSIIEYIKFFGAQVHCKVELVDCPPTHLPFDASQSAHDLLFSIGFPSHLVLGHFMPLQTSGNIEMIELVLPVPWREYARVSLGSTVGLTLFHALLSTPMAHEYTNKSVRLSG